MLYTFPNLASVSLKSRLCCDNVKVLALQCSPYRLVITYILIKWHCTYQQSALLYVGTYKFVQYSCCGSLKIYVVQIIPRRFIIYPFGGILGNEVGS